MFVLDLLVLMMKEVNLVLLMLHCINDFVMIQSDPLIHNWAENIGRILTTISPTSYLLTEYF